MKWVREAVAVTVLLSAFVCVAEDVGDIVLAEGESRTLSLFQFAHSATLAPSSTLSCDTIFGIGGDVSLSTASELTAVRELRVGGSIVGSGRLSGDPGFLLAALPVARLGSATDSLEIGDTALGADGSLSVAGSVTITGSVSVSAAVEVVIERGTTLKITSGASLTVRGRLRVRGSILIEQGGVLNYIGPMIELFKGSELRVEGGMNLGAERTVLCGQGTFSVGGSVVIESGCGLEIRSLSLFSLFQMDATVPTTVSGERLLVKNVAIEVNGSSRFALHQVTIGGGVSLNKEDSAAETPAVAIARPTATEPVSLNFNNHAELMVSEITLEIESSGSTAINSGISSKVVLLPGSTLSLPQGAKMRGLAVELLGGTIWLGEGTVAEMESVTLILPSGELTVSGGVYDGVGVKLEDGGSAEVVNVVPLPISVVPNAQAALFGSGTIASSLMIGEGATLNVYFAGAVVGDVVLATGSLIAVLSTLQIFTVSGKGSFAGGSGGLLVMNSPTSTGWMERQINFRDLDIKIAAIGVFAPGDSISGSVSIGPDESFNGSDVEISALPKGDGQSGTKLVLTHFNIDIDQSFAGYEEIEIENSEFFVSGNSAVKLGAPTLRIAGESSYTGGILDIQKAGKIVLESRAAVTVSGEATLNFADGAEIEMLSDSSTMEIVEGTLSMTGSSMTAYGGVLKVSGSATIIGENPDLVPKFLLGVDTPEEKAVTVMIMPGASLEIRGCELVEVV